MINIIDDKTKQDSMSVEFESVSDVGGYGLFEAKKINGKVLLLNGSPRANGCTSTALVEMIKIFESENIETELINLGSTGIKECIACDKCTYLHKYYIDDIVNDLAYKFESSDGIVVGSPVYYASPTGTIMSVMNRLFYSTHFPKHMKAGACVICGGRGDNTSAFDMLNKYFFISGMPVASATYCNQVHVSSAGETNSVSGLHTVRNLARNMSFMIKAFVDAKDKYGLPEIEK